MLRFMRRSHPLFSPWRAWLVGLALTLLPAFSGSLALAQGPENALLVDAPYPPYIIGDFGEQPRDGIMVRVLREAFQRLGMNLTIELMPWQRALGLAREGHVDGLVILLKSSDRENYLVYSDPVIASCGQVYYHKERRPDFNWREYEDLLGLRLGLVRGYVYGPAFHEAVARLGLSTELADGSRANMLKLFRGRVDLALEDERVAQAVLAQEPEWREVLQPAAKPTAVYNYHTALSRTSPVLPRLAELNAVLAEMRASGRIQAIQDSVVQAGAP